MAHKIFYIIMFFFISFKVFSQENNDNDNYLLLLNELNNYVENNFVSPFDSNTNIIIHYNNIFTNEIEFNNYSVINCNLNEYIYSMIDGTVEKIGYDIGQLIIIKNDDLEIHYILVNPININEGDYIKKGQLIGKIGPSYRDPYGPAILIRIKYKDIYFDPYLLLNRLISSNK